MNPNKHRLLYSKLIRGLQLLELSKKQGRIGEEQYSEKFKSYETKIRNLINSKKIDDEHPVASYFKNLPLPGFLEKHHQEQREPYSLLGGLFFKIMLLLIAFLCISYFLPHILKLQTPFLAIAFGCPLLYLTIMYFLDKYEPEPKLFVLGAFAWGAVSTILALYLNQMTMAIGGMSMSICLAGVTEELVKGFGLYRLAKHEEFNDAIDAIVYGFAIGLGFAAVENVLYYSQFVDVARAGHLTNSELQGVVFLRASLCALGHAVFTSIIGIVLAKAKLRKGAPELIDFIQGYLLAALVHGLFNGLSIHPATRGLSVVINSLLVLGGLWIFWDIIKATWEKERDWGWHLSLKK